MRRKSRTRWTPESFRFSARTSRGRGALRATEGSEAVGEAAMFAARRTQRSTRPLASSVIGIAIIAITGMQLMSTLDGTIVVVALPRMQAELGMSDAAKSWVITAYVLTFGGLLLLGGRVGDAIGHKRAFIAGGGVFHAASLVCGVAFDPAMLIVARA